MRVFTFPLAILVAISGAILCAQTSNSARALIEGDIVNAADSAPLVQARVRLERSQDEDPIYSKVDQQGHFAFRNLDPGTYQLTVDVAGFRQSRTSVDVSILRSGAVLGGVITYPAQPQQIKISKTVDDDGTIHATVSAPMLAYAAITGRVTDPYGSPMAGASVEIFKLRPESRIATPSPATPGAATMMQTMVSADSQGEYRAGRLDAGKYWVVANKPNTISRWVWQSSYRVTYYPAALDMASAKPLEIAAGQELRADIQILRQSGVTVAGHLLGLPSPGGSIRSLSTRLALMPSTSEVINPDAPYTYGEKDFQFTDVLPGRYTLFAQTDDPQSDPMNANRKPLFGTVQDVKIGPQDMAGFDVILEPVKSLSGTVEWADGCSNVPASVQLQGRNPLTINQIETPIGGDRTFVLHDVPAGRYTILMTGSGQPWNQPIPVASALQGARDILKDGLEAPWKDDNLLKIKIGCSSQAVRQ